MLARDYSTQIRDFALRKRFKGGWIFVSQEFRKYMVNLSDLRTKQRTEICLVFLTYGDKKIKGDICTQQYSEIATPLDSRKVDETTTLATHSRL